MNCFPASVSEILKHDAITLPGIYQKLHGTCMTSETTIKTIYHCSLERAFKTPMLCDVSRIHTGFGIMPKVIYCTEDEHWGIPGYCKKVFVASSPTFRGG